MKSKIYKVHPATLFFLLTLLVAFSVWLLDIYSISVFNPHTNSYLQVQSLFNAEGSRWLLRNLITNFSSFAPIGMVVVSLLGLGLAEHSGFLSALCRKIPQGKFTAIYGLSLFIALAILSNVLGDAGYVFLLPLVMLLAPRLGINPLYAMLLTFVAVSCGYSANVVVSSMDPLLAKISAEITVNLEPQNFSSGTYANYYFMATSTVVLFAVILVVGRTILKPQLKKIGYSINLSKEPLLSQRERRSLKLAIVVGLLFLALFLWLTFSPIGLFRGVSGQLIRSPFIMGALLILSFTIGLMGLTYGLFLGKYRSDRDVVAGFGFFIKEFSLFFVIAFFASQFFACLTYTRFDQFIVLYFGHIVADLELSNLGMLIAIIVYSALVNICMVSAVGKWTLIAPIFIPLFWDLGVSPDVLQAAYRLGESSTNAFTPFLYYSPFVLVLINRYIPNVSFSFLFKTTWYFSVFILLVWTLFFIVWYLLKLPVGL